MSKAQRAELEELQAEAARVPAMLRALEVRITAATAFAERAEAELAVVERPLRQVVEWNQILAGQIAWENQQEQPRSGWWLLAGVVAVAFFIAIRSY
jgi:hypothetical protein